MTSVEDLAPRTDLLNGSRDGTCLDQRSFQRLDQKLDRPIQRHNLDLKSKPTTSFSVAKKGSNSVTNMNFDGLTVNSTGLSIKSTRVFNDLIRNLTPS